MFLNLKTDLEVNQFSGGVYLTVDQPLKLYRRDSTECLPWPKSHFRVCQQSVFDPSGEYNRWLYVWLRPFRLSARLGVRWMK
jgi:hypothetical protein